MNEELIPKDYISAKQLWLMGINDVRKAWVDRTKNDVMFLKDKLNRSGIDIIRDATLGLYHSLCDYGEATVKKDVDEHYQILAVYHTQEDGTFTQNEVFLLELYRYMLETLGRYGMLFETTPSGFTNVTMTSIDKQTFDLLDRDLEAKRREKEQRLAQELILTKHEKLMRTKEWSEKQDELR
jgi:hypothetical protein